MNTWIAFWLCLAGVFGVASVLTRSMHIVVFAVAAAMSAGLAHGGLGVEIQWGAYAVLAVLLLFAVERVGKRLPRLPG